MAEKRAIEAWLASTGAEFTVGQREQFAQLVNAYELTAAGRGEVGPGDRAGAAAATWVCAYEVVRGELDLNARGRTYRAARDAAYVGAVIAVLAGMPQAEAALRSTVSSATLHEALGRDLMNGRRVTCLADHAECEGTAAQTEAWIEQHLAQIPHADHEPVSFRVHYATRRLTSLVQRNPVLGRDDL
ncbi:hypothetical protein [Antribacter gilvus]|uniref:hypothetical protein n=1 Tax=Antribacter gilvus TaxID=2304675 RepID=UPI000F7AAE2E|nr:hypothetical protein [Antribacter gilvus]